MMTTAKRKPRLQLVPAPALRQLRMALVAAACLWLAGCAGPFGLFGNRQPLFPDRNLTTQSAGDAVVAGKSSKADVLAALGKAHVIRFDSGYEVWVYRGRSADAAVAGNTEFLVLFGADGIVRKTRVRQPYESDES